MRKLLIIAFSLFPLLTIAQTRIGARGGINLANFIYRPVYDGDTKGAGPYLFRFNGGLQLGIPLSDNDNWFLYTGPYYAGKGSGSGRKLFSGKEDTLRTYLNYIELPVSIGYKFSEDAENRFGISGGVYIGYGFNGKRQWKGGSPPTEKHLHRKEKGKYKRLDAGFNFSLMYEIRSKYGVKLDYSRSIFDISKPLYQWKETNNVFSFSFFWYLPAKRKE